MEGQQQQTYSFQEARAHMTARLVERLDASVMDRAVAPDAGPVYEAFGMDLELLQAEAKGAAASLLVELRTTPASDLPIVLEGIIESMIAIGFLVGRGGPPEA